MPQYELMYILSSSVPDNEEPALTKQITDFIKEQGGEIIREEKLGKKRLAYPIKKTRNGFYVLIQFKIAADKVASVDHKVRVTQGIIRHLILNMEEIIARQEKDRREQQKIKRPAEIKPKTEGKEKKKVTEIDLDAQIEKALEGDVTK